MATLIMAKYLPDTNVLIDFGRSLTIRTKLERARENGIAFVVAPPSLIELVRGMVAQSGRFFENDKKVFVWLKGSTVLELPRPFMARILRTTTQQRSGVEPQHYNMLIEMIADSADYGDFIRKCETPNGIWRESARADEVHEAELDKEFRALHEISKRGVSSKDVATKLSQSFGAPGCRPNPLIVWRVFSAAHEFLGASISKISAGAKPRKNDSGLYTDFQLLLYSADPEITFLTREDFSNEIKNSPQKSRIVGPDSLP